MKARCRPKFRWIEVKRHQNAEMISMVNAACAWDTNELEPVFTLHDLFCSAGDADFMGINQQETIHSSG